MIKRYFFIRKIRNKIRELTIKREELEKGLCCKNPYKCKKSISKRIRKEYNILNKYKSQEANLAALLGKIGKGNISNLEIENRYNSITNS